MKIPPVSWFAGSVFLLACACSSKLAEPIYAAIRAPVGCDEAVSCGDDISLAEARSDSRKTGKDQKKCLERARLSETPIFSSGCLRHAIDHHVCDESRARGYYYSWLSIDALPNGREAFAFLREAVATGATFEPSVPLLMHDRMQVVEALESSAGEQHLALCRVTVVDGSAGPPRDCATVAIATRNDTFLRSTAYSRFDHMCIAAASFRVNGMIDIEFAIETMVDPIKFFDFLSYMLTKELALSTNRDVTRASDGAISIHHLALGCTISSLLDY